MELPHLGEQCDWKECGQLDFLPIKCYSCKNKFCTEHFQYENHECPERHTKDVQVPVCPLCDQPVPTAKGVSPDTTVSAHIDRDCKSDPAVAKRNKVYTNRCTVKKCKQKEMMKVECVTCKQSFCLKHRHPEVINLKYLKLYLRLNSNSLEAILPNLFRFKIFFSLRTMNVIKL